MSAGFRHHGDTTVHTGRIWNLVVGHFEDPDGESFDRDIVRSPGAVGIVALVDGPDDGSPLAGVDARVAGAGGDDRPAADGSGLYVVLVSQYRPAHGREMIEIPAGMRDVPGEPIDTTARRELIEEAGLDPGRIEPLTSIFPSPGMTDAVTTIVLATDCTAVAQDLQGPEERHMRVFRVPLGEAAAMIERGEIADAKTVAGILLADRRVRRPA